MKSSISLLIADEYEVVRKGVIYHLRTYADLRIIGEVNNPTDLYFQIEEERPDLVIMEINLCGSNSHDVLFRIRQIDPQIRVLIYSMSDEQVHAIRMLRSGANGFLSKKSALSEFRSAIDRVSSGGTYLNPDIALELALRGKDQTLPHEILSDREMSVLTMLAMGEEMVEIADKLNISYKTVSTYKLRVFEKLKFRNMIDLVNYVNSSGILCA